MEKVLALITESEPTKDVLCNQLSSILEGYMRVVGYATSSGTHSNITADLIVFSSSEMYDIASHRVNPACSSIIANRTLNVSSLDKLFSIANESNVLVVNDSMDNAEEVIKLLKEVGIDHLKYHPYTPGTHYDKNILYAITPGEVDLIPSSIKHKIDLGARIIDITTIIEILTRLNLLDAKARLISSKYIETIIRLSKRLHDSNVEATLNNQYLHKVLNHVNDGIIAFDDKNIITVFNETSETIFQLRSSQALGKQLSQIVRDPSIRDYLTHSSEHEEMIGKIGESHYIIGKMALDRQHSYVCTFKDTKRSMDVEKRLRQMMKKGLIAKYHLTDIIGNSPIMKSTIEKARKLASTDHSILIQGESGVGKELFASAIHNLSPRATGPYLAINFCSLAEDLAESELFGYEEGSFTGAKKGGKKGLFEEAEGGTILLDEIGDSSPRIQARLLRVLQEKEIRRIGGTDIIPINVRVLAATNRDLLKMCQNGEFRLDLYHRLKKLYLNIPPLREHLEDLPDYIDHFLNISNGKHLHFSPEVWEMFYNNPWNGNVRELQNEIDYFQAICTDGFVDLSDVPNGYSESQLYAGCDKAETQINHESYRLSEQDRYILTVVADAELEGYPVGRPAVVKMGGQIGLTESKVRARIERLSVLGLLIKGHGRRGMRLTEEGMSIYWKQKAKE